MWDYVLFLAIFAAPSTVPGTVGASKYLLDLFVFVYLKTIWGYIVRQAKY